MTNPADFAAPPVPHQLRLLEAVLFDGRTCTELARWFGASAAEIRGRVSAAARTATDRGDRDPVAALVLLRALDALEADEAARVDAMLAHQPSLQRAYADDRELVAALCQTIPPVAPSPDVFLRVSRAIDSELAN